MTRRGQGQDTETKHHHSMKQQNQQCIQHCSHCHVHSTYTYSITNICCCLCSLSVTPQIDMSNQLCLCKYNKECGVESVIYSAIWFRSNLFYSAFFGRISVNLFGMPVPDIPWLCSSASRAHINLLFVDQIFMLVGRNVCHCNNDNYNGIIEAKTCRYPISASAA